MTSPAETGFYRLKPNTRAGSIWIFQFRFDSVHFSILSTLFQFRYMHTTAMQEYPSL